MTTEMTRITGYCPKTLYHLASTGVANPQTTSTGVRIWSQSDVDAIKAHREKNRANRIGLTRLFDR
jgi:predicted DNA-binding transcriptional regulator AlpA